MLFHEGNSVLECLSEYPTLLVGKRCEPLDDSRIGLYVELSVTPCAATALRSPLPYWRGGLRFTASEA